MDKQAADSYRRPLLVSVIVPTHDRQGLLEFQLRALARQSYDDAWEVIIVDNRSPARVEGIVSQYVTRLPIKYVPAHEEQGISYARNKGVGVARGDLLAFCDCDDEVGPDWLRELVLTATHADIAAGVNETFTLNAPRREWHELARPDGGEEEGFLPVASGSNMAIWRDVLDAVGGWDSRFDGAEDRHLTWKAMVRGHRVVASPQAIVHYRFRPSLRAFMKQQFARGILEPQLFMDFRAHGMPRSSMRIALKTWVSLIYRLPFVALSARWRAVWAKRGSQALGRLVGSLRYRVLYL